MKKLLLLTFLLLSVTMTGMAQKAKNVTVSTPDEFIKAIASNTTITVKNSNILAITDALNKLDKSRELQDLENSSKLAPGVYYTEESDGRSIAIVNINNLTIIGANSKNADNHIQAEPSYADVLRFNRCKNITIKNIKAGHLEQGHCEGDVFVFGFCENVNIDNCDLYGCGVNGLSMGATKDVKVTNTEIHDCSDCMVVIADCHNVNFTKCYMHDCVSGISTWGDNSDITYVDCEIIEREYEDGDGEYEDEYANSIDMPEELFRRLGESADLFSKHLGCEYIDGVIYANIGDENLVIPNYLNFYAAYIPVYLNLEGTYVFDFLDNIDTEKGEKMYYGNGHLIVEKKAASFSYEISGNDLKSVTKIEKIGGKKKYSQGKTKDSLKDCTEAKAKAHFEFDDAPTDVESATDKVYPWGK